MAAAAIDIRGVSKVYNPGSKHPVTALDSVSLTINDNEFFTLLGPSGCGKTTLLRLIAGFEEVSGGEILLFGEEIEHLQPSQRSVNTVFQHYALFPQVNSPLGLEILHQAPISNAPFNKPVKRPIELALINKRITPVLL